MTECLFRSFSTLQFLSSDQFNPLPNFFPAREFLFRSDHFPEYSAMATTSSRSIEITVISGEDLRVDRKPVRKKTFATVKFDRQSFVGGGTEIDERGGSFPFWNEKMVVEMPVDAMFLTIEVHCGSISRNRVVGAVNVPVSDFLGRYRPESYLHLLSYRLRDGSGERNGIVNISVRVRVSESESALTSKAMVGAQVAETASFCRNVGGVVIGVPRWNPYSYKS